MEKEDNYKKLQESHPCFGNHSATTGRIHLPVSETCNIACKFCTRPRNATENRPGVTREVISPEEAVFVVKQSLDICPDIKVIGIAGPGDTLATEDALKTFRLVGKTFPDLLKCMSTNGLLLNELAEEVIKAEIDSLTVTVNAVEPAIEAKLNDGIFYHGRWIEGEEGAKILIENQLEGIRKVSKAGITVKVNTVLVPSINGTHIEEIARAVSDAGAKIYNIIPLIPNGKLKEERIPTCQEIDMARNKAAPYIDVFRHCQRCRADAIGVPGKSDFASQIYGNQRAAGDTFSHG
ncbi:MAG: radical SAM protein [Clostridiales bacterium]|nr:radical SAM protein [Clostridiales bacterium]